MTMNSKTLKSARSTPDLMNTAGPVAGLDFTCRVCEQKITEAQFIVSKAFLGYQGPGLLVSQVMNVIFNPPYAQLMRTGAFTVQEMACKECNTVMGWKMVKAYERSERWKENNYLVELGVLQEVEVPAEDAGQTQPLNLGQRSASGTVLSQAVPLGTRLSLRSAGSSDTEDSDSGPKTPTIARFSRLDDGTLVRKGSRLERKASAKRRGAPAALENLTPSDSLKKRASVPEIVIPPSATMSVFEMPDTPEAGEEGHSMTDIDESNETETEMETDMESEYEQTSSEITPTMEYASSPIHRRVASLEPSASINKPVMPRRPSEPVILGLKNQLVFTPGAPFRRSPTRTIRNAKPPPMQSLPDVPPPSVLIPSAPVYVNHHDSLTDEIDRITADLAPILEGLPKNADSTPEEIQRKLSGHDILVPDVPRPSSALDRTPTSAVVDLPSVDAPVPDAPAMPTHDADPAAPAPTTSPVTTPRRRRPSFRSVANRPSFAEQIAAAPPLPAGAVHHVGKASETSFTHSPKGSMSNLPGGSPMASPGPSSASLSSHSRTPSVGEVPQPTPLSSTAATADEVRLVPVAEVAPPPQVSTPIAQPVPTVALPAPAGGVRFEAEPVYIRDSGLERARVAELTRALGLDDLAPPIAPIRSALRSRSPSPPSAVMPESEPEMFAPVPTPSSLGVPGKTLPFPRAPTPDAAQLATRTVRKRALSQPGRRPSIADLQAARNSSRDADQALPHPPLPPPSLPVSRVPSVASASSSSITDSRTPVILGADGQPVIATRLPAMGKRPSMRNLANGGPMSGSTSSLVIPRNGSVSDLSRPSSRAGSLVDDMEQRRVVTTRLPAMPRRTPSTRIIAEDISRPSSRTNSFFDADPEDDKPTGRGRRPSAAEFGASVDAAATSMRNQFVRSTRLFRSKSKAQLA